MEDNLTNIENICGTKPDTQELIEIGSDPNFVFGIGYEVYDGLSIQIKSLRSLKNITNIEGEEWKNKSFELTLNYVLNSLL